jgi:hypothetical protein
MYHQYLLPSFLLCFTSEKQAAKAMPVVTAATPKTPFVILVGIFIDARKIDVSKLVLPLRFLRAICNHPFYFSVC